jgi:hypothetical protein
MEPGTAVFERFGHTALRVRDGGLDRVYNFGAADFLKPAFFWKFARGEADFFVVVQSFETTLALYRRTDRTVHSQQLLLPAARSEAFAAQLARAVEPAYRRYRYDQLYDNCATRVRDLIDRASDGALRRIARKREPGRRYRDYTLAAMAGHPFAHWGLDLLGGGHQDLPVDGYAEMYLPVYLRDRVAEAQLVDGAGARPLARAIEVLHTRTGPPLSRDVNAARRAQLWLVALLGALAGLALARPERSRALRQAGGLAAVALALWSGAFGCLVLPVSVLSRVHNFSPNENALLFFPLDLACALPLWRRITQGAPLPSRVKGYVALRALVLGFALLLKLAGVLPQRNWVYVGIALVFVGLASAAARREAKP